MSNTLNVFFNLNSFNLHKKFLHGEKLLMAMLDRMMD
jgi:hypothetical protein